MRYNVIKSDKNHLYYVIDTKTKEFKFVSESITNALKKAKFYNGIKN